MTAHTAEFFTLDDVNRLKIIQEVIDRRLTTQMAAQRLGITDRQCRRLLARYREDGPLGMTNRRRGKSSNNQLPPGLAEYALNIIRERYNDFGPTLACEKLSEVHGIHLSKETVRKLMTQTSLWVPRKQRERQIQRLMDKFRLSGTSGLASSTRGKPGKNNLPEQLRMKVLTLLREKYSDFGPTLAA